MSKLEHKHKCFHYTALGDSIARGVGGADNYGYVDYIKDFLEVRHPFVDLTNRAVSGYTSTDLLHQLKKETITRYSIIKADLITISIGGANLLDCLNSPDINNCLKKEIEDFSHDWPLILQELRKNLHSHAEVYVMTIYNPLTGDDPNYKDVELFIQKLNHIIKNSHYRSVYYYKVVEVYADFKGKFPDGYWKVCLWTHFCEFPPNPHPTDRGHQEIARLHEDILSK